MKRYLSTWFIATSLMLIVVAATNLVVDPYGIFRMVDQPGFNSIKPAAAKHGDMSKAYQVLRVQPRTLILGNSRAEVGLDPNHPAWPQSVRPVYNAALPGTGTATSLRYLQHVLAAAAGKPTAQPALVLWGVDFMDFLTDPSKPTPARTANADDAQSMRLMTAPASTRIRQKMRDYAESTVTLGALVDSLTTLANQRNPYSVDLTPQGFNPMRDYLKITADEGYWAVFRQKDMANIKSLSKRHKSIFDATGSTSSHFQDVQEVIRLCWQHGIELQLFVYPYHAHLLEIFGITENWSVFEEWKRQMVQLVESEASASGRLAVPMWDFSSLNTMTSEVVPAKGDRKSITRWYWEAGHFKAELGGLLLEKIFQRAPATTSANMLLTSKNVDESINQVRGYRTSYASMHPKEVEQLNAIASRSSTGPRSIPFNGTQK